MQRSVLVIEDDRDIAQLVKIHIEEFNCHVKLVHDGLAGLAEAESGRDRTFLNDQAFDGREVGGQRFAPLGSAVTQE